MNNSIIIKGAKVNNLKNIDVEIPRNKFVVLTGLSGSGKTSLAFDTLYAEGQRRYVESLSSYARQFMGKIVKPNVESIKGIPPAIAIEQKVINRNIRSTVGTTTEIYEYLKLFFARVGKTYSPVSNKEVKRETVSSVVTFLNSFTEDVNFYIMSPLNIVKGRTENEQIDVLLKQGFSRAVYDKTIHDLNDFKDKKYIVNKIYLLIDRFNQTTMKTQPGRVSDSIQTAFNEGKGVCLVQANSNKESSCKKFSTSYELDGIVFEEPTPNLFSFNNPYGACKACEGTGCIEGIANYLVIPDRSLSVFEGAVACWKGEKMGEWKNSFVENASKIGFPIHRAIENLTDAEYELLWQGNHRHNIYGIIDFFDFVKENIYKIQYKVINSRYRGITDCPECKGTHLRKDANYIKVNNKSISDLLLMPIEDLHDFFLKYNPKNENERLIIQNVLNELIKRTSFLVKVGLGYLTLNRSSRSLSGGESQRINLSTALGSSLVGSLYILDEPSVGLHTRDTNKLIEVLKYFRDIGNSVVIVEHDEDIIKNADYIIDIGPQAGRLGGEVVFSGKFEDLINTKENLTAAYICGILKIKSETSKVIAMPEYRRKWKEYIEILGAKENNLKNINVKIPLGIFTAITGVSGSGKTTLIRTILYPALKKIIEGSSERIGYFSKLNFDSNQIKDVILIDQNPIGRSSRSNPITYIKAFDDMRELFANQQLSKQRNFKAGSFSINSTGGRCEECQGEGVVHISMQFMADLTLVCPECEGKRYTDDVLDVKIAGNNINDILNMTINQAVSFFNSLPSNKTIISIITKLTYLQEVGLGYLKMGQSSASLSGGEAQRVKLAFYLTFGNNKEKSLFIFDEPTTGLHFHDINKLYYSLNKLIERGHSVIVIEHNLELVKCADWVIDLGPEGGDKGGYIVAQGTPEDIAKCTNSHTGKALALKL